MDLDRIQDERRAYIELKQTERAQTEQPVAEVAVAAVEVTQDDCPCAEVGVRTLVSGVDALPAVLDDELKTGIPLRLCGVERPRRRRRKREDEDDRPGKLSCLDMETPEPDTETMAVVATEVARRQRKRGTGKRAQPPPKKPSRPAQPVSKEAKADGRGRRTDLPSVATRPGEEALEEAKAEGLTIFRTKKNKSGYICVYPNPGRRARPFKVEVTRGGKAVYLGSFNTAEEAALYIARSPEAKAEAEAKAVSEDSGYPRTKVVSEEPRLTGEEALEEAKAEGLTIFRTKKNKSGYICVYPNPGRRARPFKVEVTRGGKAVYLGSFNTAEEAALYIARSPEAKAEAEAKAIIAEAKAAKAAKAEARAEALRVRQVKLAEARAAAGGAKRLRRLELMVHVKEREEKLGRGIGRHKKGKGLHNFALWMKEYRADDFVSELLAAVAVKAKQPDRIELVAVASTEGARALAASSVSSMPPGCSAIGSAEAVAAPSKAQLLRRLKAELLTAHAPVHPPGQSVPAAELNQIKVAPLAC